MHIKENTILILCGPSGCGKSTLAKEIASKTKAVIISSDDIRRELLCEDIDEMNPRMMSVSKQAFELLKKKVDLYSQYPVNANLIIVDSTALNAGFRQEIKEIADKNYYRCDIVLFSYKTKKEYLDLAKNIDITARQVTKFFTEISNIGSFHQKHKITKPFTWDIVVDTPSNHIEGDALIIGDVHGCYDALVALLEKNRCTITSGKIQSPYKNIIFVGDLIDKGPDSKKVLQLICDNLDVCKVVYGNHENFVYKYISGEINEPEEVLAKFSSTALKGDTEFEGLLHTIHENAYSFIIGENFIVTHSPCEKKYLAKSDTRSLKAQLNFRHSHLTEEELKSALSFLVDEDEYNFPIHVFGHISFDKIYKGKSFIGLDTNPVGGGELSSVHINGYEKPFFNGVKCTKYSDKQPLSMSRQAKQNTFSQLHDGRDIALAMACCENRVNFISGTVCPADKYES